MDLKNHNYYQSKINKSLEYLNDNLGDEISMQQLADKSNFSLFHFQRIYKAITKESPYETLLRLRLEKAVFFLKYRPKLSIANIAYESGFPSPENFSRQFKSRYQISPSAFKKNKSLHNSKIYQEQHPNDFYLHYEESRKAESKVFEVVVEEVPELSIAFTRAVFGKDGSGMVEKYLELIKWAEANEINYQGALTRFGRSLDHPGVTPASKYRYDFALRIEQKYPSSGIIEFGKIPKANYATIHCKGDIEEVAKAWDYLYSTWLSSSKYLPLHYPAVEEFIQGPEDIGWEQFNLKCRIPVTKYV